MDTTNLFRPIKNYMIFFGKNCVNSTYWDCVITLLSAVNSVPPIRTLKVKSTTKPWFDIDVLNAVQNCDKNHKTFSRSGKGIDNDNFEKVKFYLKKLLTVKKLITTKTSKSKNEFWNQNQ